MLSKPETRELYDRYGHDGLRTGGFRPTDFDLGNLADIFSAFFGDDLFGGMGGRSGRSARGSDVLAEVEIDLMEAAEGVARQVPFPVVVACATCRERRGAGNVTHDLLGLRWARAHPVGVELALRPGPSHAGLRPVRRHGADGRDPVRRLLRHRPSDDAARARRGDPARDPRRAADPDQRRGARRRARRQGRRRLRARAREARPRFVREGNDIISSVDLTMTQAALGATVQVATLEGDVELEFEPGTQPGEIRVLRGKGMPVLQGRGFGDHRVLVNVAVPGHLSDEQRRLLEEFARSEHDRNYGSDGGLFGKLGPRSAERPPPRDGLRAARAVGGGARDDDRALPRGVRGARGGCRSRADRLHGARGRGRATRGARACERARSPSAGRTPGRASTSR